MEKREDACKCLWHTQGLLDGKAEFWWLHAGANPTIQGRIPNSCNSVGPTLSLIYVSWCSDTTSLVVLKLGRNLKLELKYMVFPSFFLSSSTALIGKKIFLYVFNELKR